MASNKEATDSGAGDSKFTAVDIKFCTIMFKHLPRQLELDWDAFAKEMKLKNTNVAKVRVRQIRKKLGLDGVSAGQNASPAKPKPNNANTKVSKSGKSSKAKKATNAVEEAADAINNEDMDADDQDGEV
ncbi:hypothetical protein F5B22DRAFT_642466 [Xylaria bambusicola]|uniref:uncharacterized protein n=1 Tax=Xylaria bambusicola TaxID=326684 RepID=UPI002008412C|nr:uncharacterized protein F5B22DRAFT_642466 [Xylaria bambusicola]KAI0525447.1 hypothetical protein F5B22DRAFT_642466 [Xylaria bambusicola]